jgi:hypothetical protein
MQRASEAVAHRIVVAREVAAADARLSGKKYLLLRTPPPEVPRADARSIHRSCCYLESCGGHDTMLGLLHVWALLVHGSMRDDAQLVLIGDGVGRDVIEARCEELDVREHVQFLWQADHETIATELSVSALGLFPWLTVPVPDAASIGTLDRYLAHGLPVVAYDLPEVRGRLGSAGAYVPVGDLAQFAGAVVNLLEHPMQRARMSVDAGIRAKHFAEWRWQAADYVRMMDELVGVRVGRVVVLPRPRAAADEVEFVVRPDARSEERRRVGASHGEAPATERRVGERRSSFDLGPGIVARPRR